MKIFKDKETFGEPTWICFHDCYMYTDATFWGLIAQMLREWNDGKNLIG